MCKAHANHDQPLPPFSQTCMAPTTLHLVGGLLRDFSPLLSLKSKIFYSGGATPPHPTLRVVLNLLRICKGHPDMLVG